MGTEGGRELPDFVSELDDSYVPLGWDPRGMNINIMSQSIYQIFNK